MSEVNKGGRPFKFTDPEKLDIQIEDFFKWCNENNKIPTVTGLAVHLDTDRLTLLHYENSLDNTAYDKLDYDVKVRLINSIKRAKQRVESEYEQALFNKNSAVGAIFTLKNNYKWVDKQEVEQTNKTIEVTLED
ncbi:DNA-packaging protein [Terrisporobacter mayombei]|uniref:DNA-packaging protein gp3 n=1 Tax=Terrisporobacter mayombei TaxID=1541 RepID=A0ABY9PW36_9FIRM|nr:DNA-packaging protein [Terrisporobacter mayombei]MCC3870272.1 DNA-packaging protein [Terrisporobacter mayombei]WMT79898.1 hypothetical protein TEMA_01690 [Terrisporobacter mayombei]